MCLEKCRVRKLNFSVVFKSNKTVTVSVRPRQKIVYNCWVRA